MIKCIIIILVVLVTILEFIFSKCKYFSYYLFKLLKYVCDKLIQFEYVLTTHIYTAKKKGKLKPGLRNKNNSVDIDLAIRDKQNIVGTTKTEFIIDLPKLKSLEPLQSTPLEKEVVLEAEEEPDIDPNDIETGEKSIRDILMEEEPELFSNDHDLPSEDFASGVTIEELAETYETLSTKKTTIEQEDKATGVLNKLEGTVIGQFFLLQTECMEKAKMLINKKIGNPESKEIEFNIDAYV